LGYVFGAKIAEGGVLENLKIHYAVIKLLALLLGTAMFLPIGCTGGVFLGVYGLSWLGARDLTDGEVPYSHFYVIVAEKPDKKAMSVVKYDILEDQLRWMQEEGTEYSFLLSEKEGNFQPDKYDSFHYQVTPMEGGRQQVMIRWHGDDYSSVSKYIAEDQRVEPLYSKLAGIGHAMQAMFLVPPLTALLCWIGRRLRKRLWPGKFPADLEYTAELFMMGVFVPIYFLFWIPMADLSPWWLLAAAALTLACWATGFLRIRKRPLAPRATSIISTLLVFLFPFGTVFFAYWFWNVRKAEALPDAE
jgi:hypothetical protein